MSRLASGLHRGKGERFAKSMTAISRQRRDMINPRAAIGMEQGRDRARFALPARKEVFENGVGFGKRVGKELLKVRAAWLGLPKTFHEDVQPVRLILPRLNARQFNFF